MGAHLKRTKGDLWRAFLIQTQALAISMHAFDQGWKGEAARLANSAFLLVGRGMKSHKSILDQLHLQDHLDFVTTTSKTQLLKLTVTPTALNHVTVELVPKGLEDVRLVKYQEWWSENVMHTNEHKISRGEIIRILRDKDGGAHFDETITDPLVAAALSGKLTGFTYQSKPDEPIIPVPFGLETTMRQIAEELRATLRNLKASEGA